MNSKLNQQSLLFIIELLQNEGILNNLYIIGWAEKEERLSIQILMLMKH